MKIKTLISFLIILVIPLTVYLVVDNNQEETRHDILERYEFFSSTELKGFTPYKPKRETGLKFQDFPIAEDKFIIDISNKSNIHININYNNDIQIGLQTVYQNYKHPSSIQTASAGGGSGGIGTGVISKRNVSGGIGLSSGSVGTVNIHNTDMLNSKSIWMDSQFGMDGWDNGGWDDLPDPGGDLDDDIHLIPIPDGFLIMIFFLTLYAFLKMDRMAYLRKVYRRKK